MAFDSGSRPVADTVGAETSPADVFGVPLIERRSRPRRAGLIGISASLLALVGLMAGLCLLVLEIYYIPSGSMEETLSPADRVVERSAYLRGDVERGDVVVLTERSHGTPSLLLQVRRPVTSTSSGS